MACINFGRGGGEGEKEEGEKKEGKEGKEEGEGKKEKEKGKAGEVLREGKENEGKDKEEVKGEEENKDNILVEIWCLTLYLFRRLGELTLIVPCYFGHSSVNLEYKIAL